MPADAFLTPVARSTLTGEIFQKLVGHLMRGDWKEGDRIPAERDLCQRLDVGRASLREALKALELIGLIETRLGDGTYVCKRSEFFARPLIWAIASGSEADSHELTEARQLIEGELSRLAAQRASPEELLFMRTYLDQMEVFRDDPEGFLRADIGFHLAVGQAAHNGILLNALLLIRNLMQQWIGNAILVSGVQEKALADHHKIYNSIAAQDPAVAQSAMRDHLMEMSRYLSPVGRTDRPSIKR